MRYKPKNAHVRVFTIHTTAKVSERTNRNMPARNTLVQLLALYTNPENHNAHCYRQTDRRTTWWCQ